MHTQIPKVHSIYTYLQLEAYQSIPMRTGPEAHSAHGSVHRWKTKFMGVTRYKLAS